MTAPEPQPLKGIVPEWELPNGKVWISDVRSAAEWLKEELANIGTDNLTITKLFSTIDRAFADAVEKKQ